MTAQKMSISAKRRKPVFILLKESLYKNVDMISP